VDKGKPIVMANILNTHQRVQDGPSKTKGGKTMGKTKLGRRSKFFKENLGGYNPAEILITAIDVAKFKPKAAIYDYFGDLVMEPFFFTPDRRGVEELCAKADGAMALTGKPMMVFGIEYTGHYQEGIVQLLQERKRLVAPINAVTTSEERRSLLDYSKTDDIDTAAIAAAVAGGKVTFTRPLAGLERELRYLTRTRRSMVNQRSGFIIDLRTLLDHYWPALQGISEVINGKTEVKTIFQDLTRPIFLKFVQNIATPSQALSLGRDGLHKLSRKHKLRLGECRIDLILKSAELAEPLEERLELQYTHHLQRLVRDVERLTMEIEDIETRIEVLFVMTPGVLLLSIDQVGVTTAADFLAETGLDLKRYHSASAIIKLAGTNPVPNQSADRSAQMNISKQGNSRLRSTIVTIGRNLIEGRGNIYFKVFAAHLACTNGMHRRVAASNKFIRIAYAMLTKRELFQPDTWHGEPLAVDPLKKLRPENIEMARKTLESLLIKTNITA
jgi:transposase